MTQNLNVHLLSLSMVILLLMGCSGNSPEKSAEKFLNAFNEKNYEEARKYATPETIKLVDLMENLSKMSASADSVSHPKIEVLESKIEGDSAMVTFREKGSDETEELKLKKIDGKWLVHITKSDITAKDNSIFNTDEEGEFDSDSIESDPHANDSTSMDPAE